MIKEWLISQLRFIIIRFFALLEKRRALSVNNLHHYPMCFNSAAMEMARFSRNSNNLGDAVL